MSDTLLGTCVILVTGCVSDSSETDGQVEFLHALGNALMEGEVVRVYDTVEEAMPNVEYTLAGRPHLESDLYVRGRIVAIEAGSSDRWSNSGAREQVEILDFGSLLAELSQVLLQTEVERAISAERGSVPSRVTISLLLPPPVDLDAIERSLRSGGDIVAILDRYDSVIRARSDTYEISEDGLFLGVVSDGGQVEFPAASGAGEHDLVPAGLTVQDLESPTDQPAIALRSTDQQIVRAG